MRSSSRSCSVFGEGRQCRATRAGIPDGVPAFFFAVRHAREYRSTDQVETSLPNFEGPYPKARAAFPTLRQSLLSNFNNCGRATKYEIDYRNGWSSHPQARGQIFHRFAAECFHELVRMNESLVPPDVAEAIMRETIRQDWADRECRFCGSQRIKKGVSRNGLRQCLQCKKTFPTEFVNLPMDQVKDLAWVAIKWALSNAFDIANLVDVERRLEAVIHYPDREAGGMVARTLTGQLDALFLDAKDVRHLIVEDWKDTWALPPGDGEEGTDTVSDDGYFQQRFYAFLLFANFPKIERVTLREKYVRYSKERKVTIERKQMDEIEAGLAALAERFDRAVEEELWVATPGKHCNVCVRPSDCPIAVFARGDGRIITAERAEKVAASLIVAEKVVKDNRGALRGYADIHGPIPIADAKGRRALGYVETQRIEKPTLEDVQRAELENGGPLSSEQLAALYKVRKGTRFQAFTPKSPEQLAAEDEEEQAKLERALIASIEASNDGKARVGVDNSAEAGELAERERRRKEVELIEAALAAEKAEEEAA